MHPNSSWHSFLVWAGLALTVLFVLLKPESSSGLSAPLALVFWGAHVLGALLLLEGAQIFVSKTMVARWPSGLQLVIGGLLGAIVFTPYALVLDQVFGAAEWDDDGESVVAEFMGSAGLLILTWLALNALRMVRLPEFSTNPIADDVPAFFEKVPPELGQDLISLQAELHYLRVTTTGGNALILYPFGKAVDEMSPADGQQVHRSNWVAYAHVEALERRGQGGTARMSDGSAVNVSRAYMASLRDRL